MSDKCPKCDAELSWVIGGPDLERRQYRCGTIVTASGASDPTSTCHIHYLESENARLRAALEEYARHSEDCRDAILRFAARSQYVRPGECQSPPPCTCGLDALLQPTKGETDAS